MTNSETKVLAIGFLLVILSAALFHNFLTLLVVATYVLAPVPNWIANRCANPDDFIESNSSAWIDLGRFATGFLVVMGIGTFQLCGNDLGMVYTKSLATQLYRFSLLTAP